MSKVDKEIKNYNYGEIITPYQLKNQNWDRSIGQFTAAAYKWRQAYFYTLALILFLLLIFFSLIYSPNNKVYAVQITKNGFPVNISKIGENYKPTPQQYEAFAIEFIKNFFIVGLLDSNNAKRQWFVNQFTDNKVLKKYKDVLLNKLQSGDSRIVSIEKIKPLGNNKFQVFWNQGILKSGQGQPDKTTKMQAILTIVMGPLKDEKSIRENPFGFYVSDMQVNSPSYKGTQSAKEKTNA